MPAPLLIPEHSNLIGRGYPCFVIAEAGVNHGGNLDHALRLVDAAADAGADAVKFQTFRSDLLATVDAPRATYQGVGSQRAMLRELELSESDHHQLRARCRERDLLFLSSPFDPESAALLARLDVPAFKLASGELTNLPLLEQLTAYAKPIFVSTGMAELAEVREAVATLRRTSTPFALLHCVSRYPADAADANLRAMHTLEMAFGCPVGFSDHTLGTDVALAAVALGATILEKHLTLDRQAPGPDHASSLEPAEFTRLVASIRRVESSLGDGRKRPVAGEAEIAAVARKSLIAACDLPAGKQLTDADLAAARPGTGISPARLTDIVGKRLRVSLREGEQLRWEACE